MGVENIILAFILTRWAWFCRVIRTSVMQYTAADHVKFAKTIGMSHLLIIRKTYSSINIRRYCRYF